MCKVYLYSRVSTSQQTLAQQERTAYEWLVAHDMKVDEVVSDEGISGGVSYKERNLGKILLPKMVEGDALIVSEVSRLGRSMYDLSKLIHDELKPRKLRLIVVGMGIDLNCANITPIDQLILSNFSFAAELEKHLIRERTLSALQIKRQQGVKLGAASEKWQRSFKAKSEEEKIAIAERRGKIRSKRYKESREVTALLKILRNVFPDACKAEDPRDWKWARINTKGDNKTRVISLMKDYKELDADGTLFSKWNFDASERELQMKLSSTLHTIKRSLSTGARVVG